MSQNFRLNTGGLINRDKPIEFKFNGKKYIGYEGDTPVSYTHCQWHTFNWTKL